MFSKSLASAVAVACLAVPAAEAACIYNNSSGYAELVWISASSNYPVRIAGVVAGDHGCGDIPQHIGTLEVSANGQLFCPLPFSTNETSVTVIDDPTKPHGRHCARDVGPGWRG